MFQYITVPSSEGQAQKAKSYSPEDISRGARARLVPQKKHYAYHPKQNTCRKQSSLRQSCRLQSKQQWINSRRSRRGVEEAQQRVFEVKASEAFAKA